MTRDEIVETMARAAVEAAGFAWEACAQSQWKRNQEAAISALETKGMVVVPRELIERDLAPRYQTACNYCHGSEAVCLAVPHESWCALAKYRAFTGEHQ